MNQRSVPRIAISSSVEIDHVNMVNALLDPMSHPTYGIVVKRYRLV
jgi:hypothetical protein